MLSASSKDFQFRRIFSLPRSPNSPRRSFYLLSSERTNPDGHRVSRFVLGILVVEFGRGNALRFIRLYRRVSAPTPCVVYHGPFSDIDSSPSSRSGCITCRTLTGIYFFMNECHGVPLNTLIDGLSSSELKLITDWPGYHA